MLGPRGPLGGAKTVPPSGFTTSPAALDHAANLEPHIRRPRRATGAQNMEFLIFLLIGRTRVLMREKKSKTMLTPCQDIIHDKPFLFYIILKVWS